MPPVALPSALGRRIVKRTSAGTGVVARRRAKEKESGGGLGAVAGPAEAGLADERVGFRKEVLGLLASIRDQRVGPGAGVTGGAVAVETVHDRCEITRPAIQQVGCPASELASFVRREQKADRHASRAADEETEERGADRSSALAHERRWGDRVVGRGKITGWREIRPPQPETGRPRSGDGLSKSADRVGRQAQGTRPAHR